MSSDTVSNIYIYTASSGIIIIIIIIIIINPLTPNGHYSGRTAQLTVKRCILYSYSTNIGTAYFKHDIYSLVFSLQNAVCFIILTYLVPVLFTFYVQGVLKLKKINSGAKRLNMVYTLRFVLFKMQFVS